MKKIRIAGPPGTGKTTKLVEIYYSHLEAYSPTDIMVISHTNTAADHLRGKIFDNLSIAVFKPTFPMIVPKDVILPAIGPNGPCIAAID